MQSPYLSQTRLANTLGGCQQSVWDTEQSYQNATGCMGTSQEIHTQFRLPCVLSWYGIYFVNPKSVKGDLGCLIAKYNRLSKISRKIQYVTLCKKHLSKIRINNHITIRTAFCGIWLLIHDLDTAILTGIYKCLNSRQRLIQAYTIENRFHIKMPFNQYMVEIRWSKLEFLYWWDSIFILEQPFCRYTND